MKLQNLEGLTAKINENAYDTWLEPYIGSEVEVAKKGRTVAWIVTGYGKKFGKAKVNIECLDFNNSAL